jgi:hypothetical protein
MVRPHTQCEEAHGGTTGAKQRYADQDTKRLCPGEKAMDSIIYLVGLIVVVMFVLSFLGLR